MKHLDGAVARSNHGAVGKADPLVLILTKQLVAHCPVSRLIFATIRMDLAGNFRG
jgi:hypothetical protein